MQIFQLPVTPTNLWFVFLVGLTRLRYRLSGKRHPYDPRYLSGDAFRSLATHIFDADATFDPTSVRRGDLIFVALTHLDEYFQIIHPQISVKYRLISHNGDVGITKKYAPYLRGTIMVWWSQNVLFSHPKLRPIPIGIENMSYANHGMPAFLKVPRTKKKPQLFFGFSISTNTRIRGPLARRLRTHQCSYTPATRLNAKAYFQLLSHSQFVVSPPGNGEDCIRTWEAMYLGVIPIVAESELTRRFLSLRLPLMIVRNWEELDALTTDDLERIYENIMKKSRRTSLYFPYWKSKILSTYAN